MQKQDRIGYFVRVGTTETPDTPTRFVADKDLPPPKKRRSRGRFAVRPLHVIGLLLLAWLVWAATTPGGVTARGDDIADGIAERVHSLMDDATSDPGMKRAASYYNDRYTREGSYPHLSEEELRNDPDVGFGMGVSVNWCSAHAMVLQSLTGGGTVSRLLIEGQDYGDVHAKAECPADLANPAPWKSK